MQTECDTTYIRTLAREKWLKAVGYYAVFVVLGLMTASFLVDLIAAIASSL
jgi:hypothetical protein